MTLTDRDKKLVLFLPALLLLLGYGVWFSSTGKYGVLGAAEAAREKAEKAAPAPDRLHAAESQYAAAAAAAENARRAEKAARGRLNARLVCVDPECRRDRLVKLASLFIRHRLTVKEHADFGKEGVIPPSAEALRKQLPEPQREALHLHRIVFVARYQDVLQAAAALAGEGSVAIPVSLTMKESPTSSELHEWLMLVWV